LNEGVETNELLDHLGKPPLSKQPDPRWLKGMEALGADRNIYMKLSGAFNEFDEDTPSDIPTLLTALTPFLDHAFKCFPDRVMFGSDWPVCNVGGPKGEEGNWSLWQQVVEAWMEKQGFGVKEKESVWWKAGCEAYKIEM
jgi:L-rhamnono-1,4-lactonase